MSDTGLGAGIGLAAGGPIGSLLGGYIGSHFGNPDPTNFTSTNPSSSTAPGSIAYQGVAPTQDSGTQFFRTLANRTAQQGVGNEDKGAAGIDSAEGNLQKVLDYYQRLLSGDRSEVESAIGPEVDQISTQFDNIRKMLSQNGARGGGTASTLATLPQQQTAQVSDLINKSRRGAAEGLSKASGQQADIAKFLSTLGAGQLDSATQEELAKLGINLGERGQNTSMFNNAVSALV